jgi:hypothetical protein
MDLGFESLLITIAFILPGFITTRLLFARTPSVGTKQSLFQETTESLLRSVYINLIVGSLLLLVVQFIYIPTHQDIFSSGFRDHMANFFIHPGIPFWLSLGPASFLHGAPRTSYWHIDRRSLLSHQDVCP